MKSNVKILSRRKRIVRRPRGLNDPRAMNTVRTSGPTDPPPTSTQIVGFKRIRKGIGLSTSGAGEVTVGEIAACLPLSTNNSEFRILKMSVWGADGSGAAGSTHTLPLTCVFPVSNNPVTPLAPTPGDNATWQDDGVFGQSRPHIHLTPAFEYRNYWLGPLKNGPNAIVATFAEGFSASVIVDFTVQFRTVVQACPAMDHLDQIRSTRESTDATEFEHL